MILRTASEFDRRTADIQLTGKGLERAAADLERRKARHAEMFGALSDAEKASLLALLEKLNQDWDARYRPARPSRGRTRKGQAGS